MYNRSLATFATVDNHRRLLNLDVINASVEDVSAPPVNDGLSFVTIALFITGFVFCIMFVLIFFVFFQAMEDEKLISQLTHDNNTQIDVNVYDEGGETTKKKKTKKKKKSAERNTASGERERKSKRDASNSREEPPGSSHLEIKQKRSRKRRDRKSHDDEDLRKKKSAGSDSGSSESLVNRSHVDNKRPPSPDSIKPKVKLKRSRSKKTDESQDDSCTDSMSSLTRAPSRQGLKKKSSRKQRAANRSRRSRKSPTRDTKLYE